jgi:hypothetical protein
MAKQKFTPEDLQAISELARQWGKIVCRQAFGDQGPGLDVELTTMEEVTVAALRGLVAATLENATAQQAAHLGTHQPCPDCGRDCLIRHEPRTVTTRGGDFEHDEPVCHGTGCCRDFFPAASALEARRPRLEPGHLAQVGRNGRPRQSL